MIQHRWRSILLIAGLLPLCWLLMQMVHESGHILGAWVCGAEIQKVILHPLTVSQTMIGESQHMSFITWLGPTIGMLLPLGCWGLTALFKMPYRFLSRFFAGFCFVANGCYLAFAGNIPYTDTAVLIAGGTPQWICIVIGLVATMFGFLLWHKQSSNFGIGPTPKSVDTRAILVCWGLLVTVIISEVLA